MQELNNIKIIFVDIDWTILNHHIHDWDYESIDALKKCQEKGILIYLCTARPYDSVVHTGLLKIFHPDGIVSTNGGVAFVNDQLLYSNNIPEDVVSKVEEVANKHDLVVEMCTIRDRYFTKSPNIWVDEYFKSYAETIPPIMANQSKNVSAMLLFAPEFMDEELIKELPEEIKYYRFDLYGVDLCYHQNSKGDGVYKILNYLNINKSYSMGIGDDYGDISMFESVGTSIAMGNGKDEVKEKATYVCDHIQNSGIKKIFEELHII